jgi:hypothetical protein
MLSGYESFSLVLWDGMPHFSRPLREVGILTSRRRELRRGEVLHCKKDGAEAWSQAPKALQGLPIDFHSTTRALADTPADFKARFKMSLAEAFAAALAKEKKAELVTGD